MGAQIDPRTREGWIADALSQERIRREDLPPWAGFLLGRARYRDIPRILAWASEARDDNRRRVVMRSPAGMRCGVPALAGPMGALQAAGWRVEIEGGERC